MDITLNAVEIRILGCLIEKQLTTPDYYPLTLNSLLAACNQKSNREPVMQLSEAEVLAGLSSLIDKTLIREKMLPGSRTVKYEHKLSGTLTREYDFNQQQLAILSILFVRGPQTLGEIKGRTQRMAEFQDLERLESCLGELQQHSRGPFVKVLPKQPGRREARFAHTFDDSDNEALPAPQAPQPMPDVNELESIKLELGDLRQEVNTLKSQIQVLLKSGEL